MTIETSKTQKCLQSVGIAILVMAVSVPGQAAKKAEGHITADDLFIVDCLLPGQIRSLGSRATFVSPRRAVRTTAQDCGIRGGEFVAYDRANYATALKVWLPQANGGDAKAQVYVGEIYEQGLGVAPDYQLAVQWFRKAAEQGNSRAQINLGSLYERGLGVEKDLTEAMNWYRKASGITDGVLELTTEEEIARRRQIERERADLRLRVDNLRAQLDDLRAEVRSREQAVHDANREIEQLKVKLAEEQAAGRISPEVIQQLERLSALEQQNAQLTDQLNTANAKYREMETIARQRRLEAEAAQLDLAESELQLSKSRLTLSSAQQEIELLRSRLAGVNEHSREYAQIEQEIEDQEAELAAQRAQVSKREAEWQARLEAARERIASAEAGEDSLQEQLRLREQEIASLRSAVTGGQEQLRQAQLALANHSQEAARIAALEEEIRQQQEQIASIQNGQSAVLGQLGVASTTPVRGGPSIDIISPQVSVTRGVQSVALFSEVNDYEVVARVVPARELAVLRVNDMDLLSQVDENGFFQFRVPIEGNETPVSVEAVGPAGERAEESFVIVQDVTPAMAERSVSRVLKKRLRNDLGDYYALVIGNNAYSEYPDLATAANDANAVASVLQSRYGFRTEVVIDGNRDQIVAAMARMTDQLDDEDNLLVYYAGHGVISEDGAQGYWLPVDAQVDNQSTWISNEAVTDFLSEMKAKHVLVVADSCYSGTLSGNSIRPIPDTATDQDLLFISRVRARTVLTSGGLQPVLDQGDGQYSIFGSAFVKALEENGGLMEGYRLYRSLQNEVQTRSRLARLTQHPEYTALKHAGHEGSEFFFLPNNDVALSQALRIRM